jgi:hypothetical protein
MCPKLAATEVDGCHLILVNRVIAGRLTGIYQSDITFVDAALAAVTSYWRQPDASIT